MNITNVTKAKVLVEISAHELYVISEALDAVIKHDSILDKKDTVFGKLAFVEVHEELCAKILAVVDKNGDFISS